MCGAVVATVCALALSVVPGASASAQQAPPKPWTPPLQVVAGSANSTCFNQPKDWLGIVAEVEGRGLYDMCHLDILDCPSAQCAGFGLRLAANDKGYLASAVLPMSSNGFSLAQTPSGRCVIRFLNALSTGYSMLVVDVHAMGWCGDVDNIVQFEAAPWWDRAPPTPAANVTISVRSADRGSVKQFKVVIAPNFSSAHVTGGQPMYVPAGSEVLAAVGGSDGGTLWYAYKPIGMAGGGTVALDFSASTQWSVPHDALITRLLYSQRDEGIFAWYRNVTATAAAPAGSSVECVSGLLTGPFTLAPVSCSTVPASWLPDAGYDAIDSGGTSFRFLQGPAPKGGKGTATYGFGYMVAPDLEASATPDWLGSASVRRTYHALGFLA